MNTSNYSNVDSLQGKRYRRILKDTIRRELERELDQHFREKENLDHYLESLHLSVNGLANWSSTIQGAQELVGKCPEIKDWFDVEPFWEEHEDEFGSKWDRDDCRELLRRLLIRLHGFWVFTLDDTRHTFSFVPAPNESNEWGQKCADPGDLKSWLEVRIHFGKGVSYLPGVDSSMKIILEQALENYLLRPGEGSVGLGLRADRGVCLRDTVRDLRGAVALEDCLTRNLSYIGLPIFLEDDNKPSDLGKRGRPVGHFGIFFPAPLGWHTPRASAADWCASCTFPYNGDEDARRKKEAICLFQRAVNLRNDYIQPLVSQNYVSLSNARYKHHVEEIAKLGNHPIFQNRGVEPKRRREVFLSKVIPSQTAPDKRQGGSLRIDDFQAVQIWERHPAIAGLSEGVISVSEANFTWRQSVRWSYPDLFLAQLRQTATIFQLVDYPKVEGPWDAVGSETRNGAWIALKNAFTVSSKPIGTKQRVLLARARTDGEPELGPSCSFWKMALEEIPKTLPPESLPEFRNRRTDLDRAVVGLKWQRLLSSHLAQCLVARLAGKSVAVSKFLFSKNAMGWKHLANELNRVTPIPDLLLVSVIGGDDLRLETGSGVIVSTGRLKPLHERLEFELKEEGHTLPVFLALANATKRLLEADPSIVFRTNHGESPYPGSDWPIQSEAYLSDAAQKMHVDCGVETAFSIPAIWSAWCKEFATEDDCAGLDALDTIRLTKETTGIRVTLFNAKTPDTTVSFRLIDNNEHCVAYHHLLAHDTTGIENLREAAAGKIDRGEHGTLTPDEKNVLRLWESFAQERETLETDEPQVDLSDRTAFSRTWRGKQHEDEPTCNAAAQVAAFLENCGTCDGCQANDSQDDAYFVVLAKVANEWKIQRRCFSNPSQSDVSSSKCDAPIAQFRHIVASEGDDNHPLGPDFGLTSHVFVPLRRPTDHGYTKSHVGFMVLSGSQIEHDTIRRVDVRPAQLALAQFAADYLEYAISQEVQLVRQYASLQRVAHSLAQDGSFYQSAKAAAERYNRILNQCTTTGDVLACSKALEKLVSREDSLLGSLLSDFIQNCAFLIDSEDTFFTFSARLGALKQFLVGKPEEPPAESAPSAANLRTWLEYLLKRVKIKEGHRKPPTTFVIQPSLAGADTITTFPVGSLCILFDELARNAAKHHLEGTQPTIAVQFDTRTSTLQIFVDNKISSAPCGESTGGGLPIMEMLIQANFGSRAIEHCGPVDDSDIWHVAIALNLQSYHKALERTRFEK